MEAFSYQDMTIPTCFRIRALWNGAKADRSFQKARCGIRPGDWIVRPYSPHLVNVLRKAVEKGRLVMK